MKEKFSHYPVLTEGEGTAISFKLPDGKSIKFVFEESATLKVCCHDNNIVGGHTLIISVIIHAVFADDTLVL